MSDTTAPVPTAPPVPAVAGGALLANATVLVTVLLVVLGPGRLAIPFVGGVYRGVAVLVLGGALLASRDLLTTGLSLPRLLTSGLVLVTVPLLAHGSTGLAGLSTLVVVPFAAAVVATRVTPRTVIVAAALATIPLTVASAQQLADPASFLTSEFREGEQGISIAGSADRTRVSGTFPSPGTMAATTVALLVLVLWATTSTRLGRWSRLLGTVTAVGLVALTAATYSRAALGAIFLVGGLALLRDARRGRALLYLAVGIGLLIVLVGPLASGFDDRAGLGDRITIAKAAVEVGADQPLFGIGFAALPSRLWLPATGDVYHAHFLPAHYFVELGLVGLAGFALVIVSVVRNSRHSRMGRIALWGALVFAVLDVGVFLYPRSAAVIWLALLITAEPVDRAATTPA